MRLALAGDTMLGRGVGERLRSDPGAELLAAEVLEVIGDADAFVLNLECCISERGQRFPAVGKPFFFRAPPVAAERLAELGVACVTLANNHALDFGAQALLDTLDHLRSAGVAWVGAGPDAAAATAPFTLERAGMRLRIVAATDHPAAYAATADAPGVAYADLRRRPLPGWLRDGARPGDGCAATLVTPHWGPNMSAEPVAHVRRAADELAEAGATLVAGHSAHVFQGVAGRVLFDLGDFVDDYAVDAVLRNDLGLLFLVDLDPGPRRIEAVPLKLEYARTRLASGEEARLVAELFAGRCRAVGTGVRREDGRLVVTPA